MVNISIVGGGGLMGKLIGIELAKNGHSISLYDTHTINPEPQFTNLSQSGLLTETDITKIRSNITYQPYGVIHPNELYRHSDIIIECIPDNLVSKQNLIDTITHSCSEHTIIMTNAISLSVSDIACKAKNPSKIIGCRFLYPVVLMDKVELTLGKHTSSDTVERTKGFLSEMGYNVVYKISNQIPVVRLTHAEIITAQEKAKMKRMETAPNLLDLGGEEESETNEFNCPISMTRMTDPVVAMDGHTYERSSILQWFSTKSTSPMTGLSIGTTLVPNFTLKKYILAETSTK
jgi:3-hydroxyacyl-CoA dehydrogenase